MSQTRLIVLRGPVLHAALTVFVLVGSLQAQEVSVPAAAGSQLEVRLETRDGKNQFYIGDRIELELVFRNTTPDLHGLNSTDYGDIADKVEIVPASGWTQWRGQSAHDYVGFTTLGSTELLRVPVVLNRGFVFKEPGHYEIRVKTDRLSLGGGHLVTTNAVGIDLVPMQADVELEQVKSLMSKIGTAWTDARGSTKARQEAVSRLADLQGDVALIAKVRMILAGDLEMGRVSREALASTRNLQLQLALLEDAWKDPTISPVYDMPDALQETRALIRGQTLPGWVMVTGGPDRRATEEHKVDMEDLLRSLPMRSGQNRADAAYYLMMDRALPAADRAVAKPVALEEFAHMNDIEQHMLLELAWPAIRDVSLTSALRAMLDRSPTDKDAIERLDELEAQVRYPNEITGLELYSRFLSPLNPGVSKAQEVHQRLSSADEWRITPLFSCLEDAATCSRGGDSSETLFMIVITPIHTVSLRRSRFSKAFTRSNGFVSEVNVQCDVYKDRHGLEYWILADDSDRGKKGDLYQIVYGPGK